MEKTDFDVCLCPSFLDIFLHYCYNLSNKNLGGFLFMKKKCFLGGVFLYSFIVQRFRLYLMQTVI